MMRAFKNRDTAPELAVRRVAYQMGYRYRLHRKDLPGRPDVVFVSRRKAIFIHGCFWHSHGCKLTRLPNSNLGYWLPKLKGNRDRDKRNVRALAAEGWKCLIIWECEVESHGTLQDRLRKFLE
jgi:DNA mismatch endonuclease (patch repair protein)